MSSKFHLSKWKTYFSQFADEFLKNEEVEYLIHCANIFKLILCKFPLFSQFIHKLKIKIFEYWCYPVLTFHHPPSPAQFTQRLKTGSLNVALGWTYFSQFMKEIQNWNFLD